MVPVKKEGSVSPSRFNLKEKFGTLQFFSMDTNNRWAVQGGSRGDEANHELDKQFVAEECAREFTLDQETRWPLQGWCKTSKSYKTPDESAISTNPCVQSRWPQGW